MARVMRGFAVLAGLAAVYDLVCYIGTWVDLPGVQAIAEWDLLALPLIVIALSRLNAHWRRTSTWLIAPYRLPPLMVAAYLLIFAHVPLMPITAGSPFTGLLGVPHAPPPFLMTLDVWSYQIMLMGVFMWAIASVFLWLAADPRHLSIDVPPRLLTIDTPRATIAWGVPLLVGMTWAAIGTGIVAQIACGPSPNLTTYWVLIAAFGIGAAWDMLNTCYGITVDADAGTVTFRRLFRRETIPAIEVTAARIIPAWAMRLSTSHGGRWLGYLWRTPEDPVLLAAALRAANPAIVLDPRLVVLLSDLAPTTSAAPAVSPHPAP